MLQLRAFILLGLCFAVPARAGLFSDDEARQQVQKLEARVLKLEPLEDAIKQQTKSLLDLQSQLDDLKTQLRDLRGQNEELAHGLQDAEKREKDFYVDLDTRVRHFESTDTTASGAANGAVDPSDPALEDRAFEAAYAWVKTGNSGNALKALQDFIGKYPDSVHMPNALYWLAVTQYALKDSKSALQSYQTLLSAYPSAPRAADAMLNMAVCQQDLKQHAAAQKTLKQLIAKYPNSAAADKAHKLLAVSK
ncbi:MAG: tol-pal system protein YbgF [Gallionella sp.]|jgi:tol-pal system protein YbgF|nr:tol-pal system protein YbgF [Gallionella sp.]